MYDYTWYIPKHVGQGDVQLYMLFLTTKRRVFLNPYHCAGEGQSSGTLTILARQELQRQPILEEHARRVLFPS